MAVTESNPSGANLDTDAQRRYWSTQLDDAFEFMRRSTEAPLDDNCERAVDLTQVFPGHLECTFAESVQDFNQDGFFYLRESLVPRLEQVIGSLNSLGLGLRIEFGYRTPQTQERLFMSEGVLGRVISATITEAGGQRPDPELVYRRTLVLCANVYKNGTHLGASALDVSLYYREDGEPLDVGGPYLTISEVTPMASPYVTRQQKQNRSLVSRMFREQDFLAYPYEFWHFSAGDVFGSLIEERSDRKAKYGPVLIDPSTGDVTPIPSPEREIVPREVALRRIEEMLDQRYADAEG